MPRQSSSSHRGGNGGRGDTSSLPSWLPIAIVIVVLLLVGGGIAAKLLWPDTPEDVDHFTGNPNRPVAAAQKTVLTILLDNSDSMKGYAQSPAFINILSDIEGIGQPSDFRLTDSTRIKGDWIHQLRSGGVAFVSHSMLNADLAQAVATAAKDRVAVLVTDGIMSGSNEQLREDPDYNLVHANKELKNGITQALRSTGKKPVAVAVYEFMVPFTGIYYCYNNGHGTLHEVPRRFYAIAVGGPEALAYFHHRMMTLAPASRPLNEWVAIDPLPLGGLVSLDNDDVSFEPLEAGRTVFTTDRQKWATGHKGLTILLQAKPLLANQLLKPEDLVKATELTLHVDGTPCPATASLRGDQFAINVPKDYIPGGDKEVSIILQLDLKNDELPAWVGNASTDNDASMLTLPNARTFLFDRLMDGVRAGMPARTGKHLYSDTIIIRNR